MRNRSRRLAAMLRAAVVLAVALAIASPASAQFGGLKKKLKAAAAPEATADEGADEAEPAGDDGGMIVLTEDVVERLVTGLKAGDAERRSAAKEDTPYGRYERELAAYEIAKPKCQQAQQGFYNRMVANEKLADKYNDLVNKMVEAQGRGDNKLMTVYQDSSLAMQDPSCTVKQPEEPSDYYVARRAIDTRAEEQEMKKSGFSRGELSQVRERVEMALRDGTAPGGLSASEKSVVSARAAELKPLLGIVPPPSAPKPAPAPAAAPAPQPAAQVPPGAAAMSNCMAQNTQKHEKKIVALSERAEAAQQAGNTTALMAIADSIQRLQMAGCGGGY